MFYFSAWIETANVKPFFLYKDRLITQNKTGPFKEAVEAIEKYIAENEIQVSEFFGISENCLPFKRTKYYLKLTLMELYEEVK